jgi:hypothetical protein
MSYGHAHELLANGAKSPAAELRVAVRKLKAWADLNPRLVELYLDFEACLRDIDAHLQEHTSPIPEEDLEVEVFRRGKHAVGVRLTHLPTGLVTSAFRASAIQAKTHALTELRAKISGHAGEPREH